MRDFVEVVAIHKPQKVNIKTEKKKEITIIYQIKELIFNEVLIFNFQFFLNPPVASQHPPLQREANSHKSLITNTKTEKKKEFH